MRHEPMMNLIKHTEDWWEPIIINNPSSISQKKMNRAEREIVGIIRAISEAKLAKERMATLGFLDKNRTKLADDHQRKINPIVKEVLNGVSVDRAIALFWEDNKIFSGFIYALDNDSNHRHKNIPVFDLRHRVSKSFLQCENIQEIKEEIECLPKKSQEAFLRFALFYFVYQKTLLTPDELNIITYFEGSLSIDDLGLTRENARETLILVKLADLALLWQGRISRTSLQFKNTSEAIRTRILQLLSPELSTSEAYTLAVDPKKITKDYLKNQKHWIPERIRLYAQVIPKEFIEMLELSRRLNDTPPPMCMP